MVIDRAFFWEESVVDPYDVKDNINSRAPLRAQAKQLTQVRAKRGKRKELPPWLVIKNRVVMRWAGRHHVARIGEEDPFETAQRLFERLKARTH